MSLEIQIEGVLFYKTEPMKKTALAEFFAVSEESLTESLETLRVRLIEGATRLVTTDTSVQLVLASEVGEVVERLKKDELKSDIGRAGAETLAIVLYRGPVSRVEIDRIRGVNSSFILRNLLIRGLVEKHEHPENNRLFTYAVTPVLMNHLGVTEKQTLPEFETIMNALDTFEKEQREAQSAEEIAVSESTN